MKYKNIIFDLDGTLIDSAPGIEESFYKAYLNVYKKECPKIITTLIGPPIDEVLTAINGETNLGIISSFVDEFKAHYDSEGFKKSVLFDNVITVLEFLVANNLNVFIATNKREKPTKLILEFLSIDKYFTGIYSPDIFGIKFKNKTELISYILVSNSLFLNETLLIGDTIYDGIAAEQNNFDFAFVEYGYGQFESCKFKLNNIKQLISIL